MLEGVHRDDGADRGVRLGQFFGAGHAVHTRPRPHIHADIFLSRKQAAQIADAFLTGYLIRADFKDGFGASKGFRECPRNAMKKVVHGFSPS